MNNNRDTNKGKVLPVVAEPTMENWQAIYKEMSYYYTTLKSLGDEDNALEIMKAYSDTTRVCTRLLEATRNLDDAVSEHTGEVFSSEEDEAFGAARKKACEEKIKHYNEKVDALQSLLGARVERIRCYAWSMMLAKPTMQDRAEFTVKTVTLDNIARDFEKYHYCLKKAGDEDAARYVSELFGQIKPLHAKLTEAYSHFKILSNSTHNYATADDIKQAFSELQANADSIDQVVESARKRYEKSEDARRIMLTMKVE
jgi:hypothetical protein